VTAKAARLYRAAGAALKVEAAGSCKVMERARRKKRGTLDRGVLRCAYVLRHMPRRPFRASFAAKS
jgi:hypothetical protein